MVGIKIVVSDIMNHPSDLLILKHADGFYGVDGLVADRIGFQGVVGEGDYAFVNGTNIEARTVLFVGVGPLYDFRYEKIRKFAANALRAAAGSRPGIKIISSSIHGPGYGLDEKESFLSLIGGFIDAIEEDDAPKELRRIEIVELNRQRAGRLEILLDEVTSDGAYGAGFQKFTLLLNIPRIGNWSRLAQAAKVKPSFSLQCRFPMHTATSGISPYKKHAPM